MKPINFESHVTIEPVFDEKFELFEKIANTFKFKPAHLLMMKSRSETLERSNKDSFCTGHAKDFDILKNRTEELVKLLEANNFKVWKYKIEATLLDIKKERLYQIGTT